jgi:tetratricopeptide (TPR) repeat protein
VLAKLDGFPEAESCTSEAVARHRKLMTTNRRRDRPELARSLDNLVDLRVRAGRHAEALDPADEAVALHRRLADLEPARYSPELARALINHSVCLSELHRHAEALPIAQEAVQRYRQLDAAGQHPADRAAGSRPRRYALRLAHALDNLAVDLAELHRHPEAEDCRVEARELQRQYGEAAAQGALGDTDLTDSDE